MDPGGLHCWQHGVNEGEFWSAHQPAGGQGNGAGEDMMLTHVCGCQPPRPAGAHVHTPEQAQTQTHRKTQQMSATLCDEYCMLSSLRRGLSFHIGIVNRGISRAPADWQKRATLRATQAQRKVPEACQQWKPCLLMFVPLLCDQRHLGHLESL